MLTAPIFLRNMESRQKLLKLTYKNFEMFLFNSNYLPLEMWMKSSQDQHIKLAGVLKANCLLRHFQKILKLVNITRKTVSFCILDVHQNILLEGYNGLQVKAVKLCWCLIGKMLSLLKASEVTVQILCGLQLVQLSWE